MKLISALLTTLFLISCARNPPESPTPETIGSEWPHINPTDLYGLLIVTLVGIGDTSPEQHLKDYADGVIENPDGSLTAGNIFETTTLKKLPEPDLYEIRKTERNFPVKKRLPPTEIYIAKRETDHWKIIRKTTQKN